MPNSHDIYTGDGVLTNFIYTFKILAASEISVELDGAVEAPANYTVNESQTRIEFSTPPAGGVHIKILRTSAIADANKHVDFVAGSSPTESNFDTMYDHLLHLAQEANDASSAKGPALGLDQVDDKWDGESKILKDLKDPLSDQEAATKLYVDQLLQFGASGVPQVFAFTGDGTTLDFTLTGANAETNAGWIVALDGVLQAPSTGATVRDFKVESGKLTFEDGANPPPNGSLIIATNFGIAKNVLDGSVTVSAKAAADVPLTIKGVSGQTANLQEWRNSGGATIAKVDFQGSFTTQTNLRVRENAGQGTDSYANAHLNSGGVNDKPLVVRGFSGQSASLQEWQISDGKTLSLIKSNGRWRINNDITVFPHAADDASATVQINTKDSASEVLVLRAASNQSTNLQEWQNSSGVTLASINSAGSYGTTNGWVSAKKTRLGDTSQDMTNKTAYVEAQLPTDVPLTVQGDADQSASLQEWQNSGGTTVVFVAAGGTIGTKSDLRVNHGVGSTIDTLANAHLQSGGASSKPLVVRAYDGQTANITEWQDDENNVLASVDKDGVLTHKGPQVFAMGEVRVSGSSHTLKAGSFNVASVTRLSTQRDRITFTTAAANVNYVVVVSGIYNGAGSNNFAGTELGKETTTTFETRFTTESSNFIEGYSFVVYTL